MWELARIFSHEIFFEHCSPTFLCTTICHQNRLRQIAGGRLRTLWFTLLKKNKNVSLSKLGASDLSMGKNKTHYENLFKTVDKTKQAVRLAFGSGEATTALNLSSTIEIFGGPINDYS